MTSSKRKRETASGRCRSSALNKQGLSHPFITRDAGMRPSREQNGYDQTSIIPDNRLLNSVTAGQSPIRYPVHFSSVTNAHTLHV